MHRSILRGTIATTFVLATLLSVNGIGPAAPATLAAAVNAAAPPLGAPMEDTAYAKEWPSPNGDLYNTRVASSTISSKNVSKLGVAWTVPLKGAGSFGSDFANPLVANGVVYLQDGASNVTAIQYSTGEQLWTHLYNSSTVGPNGVTIAGGKIYGVTATGVFALDAKTGKQLWYNTHLAARKASYDIPAQVSNGRVYVSSALTVGGGLLYALNADTGAKLWSFQTVPDAVGQKIASLGAGGAWNAFMIGPDGSVYAGIGNPYLSQVAALKSPTRELYTDSIVKLNAATGKLDWYYQAFPDDFHDWDMQISPIYTAGGGHPVVLDASKGGFVFAFDPSSGKLLWKTSVGVHNGHDNDGALALAGKLVLKAPYSVSPGDFGGVETNMAADGGVVYVPVVDAPQKMASVKDVFGSVNYAAAKGEMVAIDIATGKTLWDTKLPQMALGGATVANDLVFTTTYDGTVYALSRTNGSIVWHTQLPAGSNATLAVFGDMVIAGAGTPLAKSQHPRVVAYKIGAKGTIAQTPTGPATGSGSGGSLVVKAAAHTASLALVAGSTSANNGFNFNGASAGQMTVTIPLGYKVTVNFSNAASLPHSAVVTAFANKSAASFPPAFSGSTTPNATVGISQGAKQTFTFTAAKVGTYAIVCAVPGHAAAGMWDTLKIVSGGSASVVIASGGH